MSELDKFDRDILATLQRNGRLTNNELAERIGLSASQCSRRRMRLESTGVIRGYQALVDKTAAGVSTLSMVSITLATHDADNALRFAELVADRAEVLEAHSLTGEMDYLLKVVSADLKSLSDFISAVLLTHDSVAHVKTAIVLDTLKETSAIPV